MKNLKKYIKNIQKRDKQSNQNKVLKIEANIINNIEMNTKNILPITDRNWEMKKLKIKLIFKQKVKQALKSKNQVANKIVIKLLF